MKDPLNSRYGTLTPIDLRRYGENPRSPTSPTVEHLMGGEASRWSPHSSPVIRRDHDPEEDHTHHQKKSVLTKVKERAKKLRQSLSGKKKHIEESNTTPSWGVSLEDEEEEKDAEYLGAPMYESELAPEGYKVHARHYPREISVISEKQVLASSVNHSVEQEKEKPATPPTTPKQTSTPTTPNETTPNKTITETVTEKLAPAYATVSDATHAIASKIQGLTVSSPATPEVKKLPALETEKPASPTGQMWDKGVSVKEFIKNKFEPGEDERALSQGVLWRR
ncbi:low-temperature-induced 65 kDa protein [Pistacia vera]|uniref:low-temperature-induced 65 kDa protein n=1 Tax=Pistacia vera TaxID=55513 RepID=UPI001263668B|nr:low-temperature-induced 65 kDa protein [Pistacia vera]